MKKLFRGFIRHMKKMGSTNRMGLYIILMLAFGLAGGFYLALKSIEYGYVGALVCWTAVFGPIGSIGGIVLTQIVRKSQMENTSANGDGIKYAAAQAHGFDVPEDEYTNSPPI